MNSFQGDPTDESAYTKTLFATQKVKVHCIHACTVVPLSIQSLFQKEYGGYRGQLFATEPVQL